MGTYNRQGTVLITSVAHTLHKGRRKKSMGPDERNTNRRGKYQERDRKKESKKKENS